MSKIYINVLVPIPEIAYVIKKSGKVYIVDEKRYNTENIIIAINVHI